jgi:hypothetical protein
VVSTIRATSSWWRGWSRSTRSVTG